MWFVGLLLLAAAGGLFYGYRSKRKRLGQIVSTDVHTVEHLRELASSMAEGFGTGALRFPAAVTGRVRCAEPLTSELTQTPAVYYSMRVAREYEEERSGSGSRAGSATQRSSEQVASNQRSVAFQITGATGSLQVDPSGAKVLGAESVLSRFEPAGADESALRVGRFELELTPRSGSSRTLGYKFHEEVVPLDREVYVLGEVTDPGGELRIGVPEGEGELIVSLKSRTQLVKELGSGSKGMKIGAIVCAVAGLLLVLFG